MSYAPHLLIAQKYWKQWLRPGDGAVDATCGNGHDLLFLCRHLLEDSRSYVIGLDIQKLALQRSQALLQRELSAEKQLRVQLLERSHADINAELFPFRPRLVIYNLGYLPRGDHAITTQTATTLASLERVLALLDEEGAISITCYSGHPEGAREEQALLHVIEELDPKKWEVCHHRWINRPKSPTFLWIKGRLWSDRNLDA